MRRLCPSPGQPQMLDLSFYFIYFIYFPSNRAVPPLQSCCFPYPMPSPNPWNPGNSAALLFEPYLVNRASCQGSFTSYSPLTTSTSLISWKRSFLWIWPSKNSARQRKHLNSEEQLKKMTITYFILFLTSIPAQFSGVCATGTLKSLHYSAARARDTWDMPCTMPGSLLELPLIINPFDCARSGACSVFQREMLHVWAGWIPSFPGMCPIEDNGDLLLPRAAERASLNLLSGIAVTKPRVITEPK